MTKFHRRLFRPAIRALDRASVRVDAGEIVGVVGPNGAGKTTLLAVSLGFLRPDDGIVARSARGMGWMPEYPLAQSGSSAAEAIDLQLRIGRWTRDSRSRRVEMVLARVGLSDFRDLPLSAFSRGMRQRFSLAYAIAPEPELLVLDEPTVSLDPGGVRVLRQVVKDEASRGAAVLMSSHHLDELARVASRVYQMERGAICREVSLQGESLLAVRIRFVGCEAPIVRASPPLARDWEVHWPTARATVSSLADAADLVAYLHTCGFRIAAVERESVDLEGLLFPEEDPT